MTTLINNRRPVFIPTNLDWFKLGLSVKSVEELEKLLYQAQEEYEREPETLPWLQAIEATFIEKGGDPDIVIPF